MSLEDWVVQRYARPVVVVESSSATNAICARNGVDLIHLLRLHSVYAGGPLHAHTGDRSEPTVCHKFGVRLMRTECVLEVGLSQLTKHTRRMMRDAVVMDLAYGEKFDAALEEIVEKSRSRHDGSLPRPVRPAQACTSSSPSSTPSKWIGGPAAVSTLLERSCPPWHHTFIHDFHNLVRCSSFDTIDYPVGAIFAVATNEAGGIEGILKAFRVQAQRIQELRASLPGMDTELHYYYLILHDNTSPLSPSLSTARQLLAAVQQRYGANYCALIKLNSVVDPRTVKNLDPSMWIEASPKVMDVPSARALHQAAAAASSAAAAATPRSPNASTTSLSSSAVPPNGDAIGRTPALSFRTVQSTFGTWPNSSTAIITGCYMSPEDVTEVHNVMAYYLSQSLFKFIEQRLRMLDLSVQDRRTTTLGKMAAWFKGKDEGRPRSADVVNVPNGFDSSLRPMYVAHSLEMQMRHCGDLSLALHDLKGAASYYRMCIDELLETLALRPFNRAFIAACQEGIGVTQLLQGKLAPQSLTPWYTGVMSTMQRVSSQANRWEVAWNDYLAAGMPVHAMRVAFLLYENSRLHMPPMLDRCQAILTHLQRSGILRQHNLINGIVNDMLAGMAVFTNPPFPAGLAVSPSIPRDYPIYMSLRRFAQRLQQAGALYRTENLPEQALRCYLRVLKLFRVIDPQETWKTLTEHLYLTAGQLYAQLGQDVRGIAMISAAVAQGTPLYRNPATAQQAFEAFWAQQKGVLSRISYTLCPHMTMPRILRGSFHIDRNLFSTDTLTDDATRKMGEAAAKREWRSMEKHLQNYTKKNLGVHPHYHLSILQGGDKDSIGGSSHGGPRHTANNGHRHSPTADAHGEVSSRALSRQTGLRQNEFGPAVEETTSGGAPQALRRYTIAKAEPLVLSFIMENPIGCSIEVTELTLLYLACTSPEQLWKSSATQTVRLKAGACQRVSLSFDPVTEGEYAIIGFCWCLLGQEGYYYFATRESRPGCPESTYEYAIEHPSPSLDAPENIYVSVTPSKARVTATFRPPLPEHLYDGEYFHTSLVLHNTSAQQDAAHVVLQRHPAASHLMYMEEFGRLQNLDRETPLVLAEHLKAQETRTFAVTIRAQHRRSDAALQNTINYFFLLLGYLPGPLTAPERLEPSPPASAMELDTTGLTALTGSSPVSTLTTPTSAQPHSPTAAFWTYKTSGGPAAAVRLHRLLRQCEVQPVVAMYSTVLPPANASLRTAVVLTVKNICTVVASTPSSETATTPPSVANVVQNVPHSSDGNELSSRHPHGKIPSYTPVRVARVLAVHSPRWGVECEGTEDLFADCAMHCLLSQGDSLTLPLLVKRQQHAAKDADTTLQGMDLSNAAAGAQCPYSDTTCIALVNALPSPARAKAVEEQLGTSVSQSERNLFFLQTSCLGPGDVGANSSPQRAGGSLAFYADKAGQQKVKLKTAQQRRCDEIGEERRLCGGPIEQYTPLAIAVTWVREEGGVGVDSQKQRNGGGGGVKLRKGQVFLFVDPIEHVYQTLAQQQQRHAEQETAASLRPVLSTVGAARVSVVQSQQELCEAMLVRYTSLKPWQGALVSHVHVPPIMRVAKGQTLDKTVAAQIPVTLRCLSLAPVPLLVTAEALPPSVPHSSLSSLGPARIGGARGDQHGSPAMPQPLPSPSVSAIRRSDASVLFVGKTTHTFLLMPSEEYEVKFTALPLRPGLVDCQRISLSAASICFLHSTAAKRGDDDGGTENMRCAASVPSTSQEGGGNTATAAQPLMRTGMTLPALIRALRSCGTPSAAANPTRGTSRSARQLWGRERSDADADADERRTAEWPRSQRTSQGYPVVAGHDTVLTLVERYGARAAELVHQLAPLGPAGGATVSQVIPSTAPALTHVIIVDDEVSTRPTTGDGAGVAVQKEAPPAMTHSRNAARKFFRQLESFEMELEKASRRNPSDPFALQYIYRPTVKMAEGDASKAGYYTTNSSLATSKSLISATGITGNAEAPLRNTSWNSPSTPAAVPSLTTDTTSMISGGGTTTSGISHKANHPARAVAETSIGAQETSPSALSLSHQPLDAVTEELPSPLHLPAVAFESRAADTALTFDVGEMKTAL